MKILTVLTIYILKVNYRLTVNYSEPYSGTLPLLVPA